MELRLNLQQKPVRGFCCVKESSVRKTISKRTVFLLLHGTVNLSSGSKIDNRVHNACDSQHTKHFKDKVMRVLRNKIKS